MNPAEEIPLERATAELGLKDLLGAFERHYRERNRDDRESWPLALTRREWRQAFGEFLLEQGPDE